MSYFDRFPKFAYDVKNNGNYKIVTDILKRVKIRSAINNSSMLFDKYDVVAGENPEDIAFGEVQKWFYMCQPDSPDMVAERAKRQAVLDSILPDVNPVTVEQSANAWTSSLDRFVGSGDCEMVGATAMKPEWLLKVKKQNLRG